MYHFPNMLAWPERVLARAVAFASVVAGHSEPEQSVREPVAVNMVSDSVLHHRRPFSVEVCAGCLIAFLQQQQQQQDASPLPGSE